MVRVVTVIKLGRQEIVGVVKMQVDREVLGEKLLVAFCDPYMQLVAAAGT